jgi:transcriptional regulator with XRE-family HTH domain
MLHSEENAPGVVAGSRSTATTGVDDLDRALNGLFWGDNVVFAADDAADVEPFFRAVAAKAPLYAASAFVNLVREPAELAEAYPGLELVDARAGSPLAQPRPLLDAIAERCTGAPRQLLLFDSIEAMSERWGRETAGRFFSRGCPLLLGLGAIAYWSLPAARHTPALRREIEGITQCVLDVGDGRLRIAKAEGRPPGVEGSVFRYGLAAGLPVLEAAPAAARLGAALRSLRVSRHLSQADLARLAGVSPSAISQAERGRRGLSLETLLDLAAKLNITLDELLRGDVAPGYRLARRDDPRHAETDTPVPLLDDPRAGLRVYLVRLSPGGSATPEFAHKGVEVVNVATGLVQVLLASGGPVLRQGEALIADRSGVTGWRNLSDREAIVFWVLHDDPAAVAAGD